MPVFNGYEYFQVSRSEARLTRFIAELSGEAAGTATRVQQCLLGLLLVLQRLVRWVQLAAVALQLQGQRQQLVFAGAAAAPVGSDGGASLGAAPVAAAAPAPAPAVQQQPAAAVMDFLSAATMGAVEQLRHTLTDATQGIESKMSALERTASIVQGTLFQAAQAHSEAVRSNPEGGMWKQPCVASVISEEERLRQAVFAQVYAELLQKDNKDISFKP
ncbi:expressed protein [Chlorella variabilis]|uniref:Expressed protein n=1 Tax=Chlorella variabilis TaxID=554065 RepID=E1Z8S5_CHLVA|nr:expressed protein [Chlorella variabilis]EFN57658.1 expressed protein [Chlorella variabilis]|eukprot:XP_005849760.1 expressed protein [Chlorella variabilis]